MSHLIWNPCWICPHEHTHVTRQVYLCPFCRYCPHQFLYAPCSWPCHPHALDFPQPFESKTRIIPIDKTTLVCTVNPAGHSRPSGTVPFWFLNLLVVGMAFHLWRVLDLATLSTLNTQITWRNYVSLLPYATQFVDKVWLSILWKSPDAEVLTSHFQTNCVFW